MTAANIQRGVRIPSDLEVVVSRTVLDRLMDSDNGLVHGRRAIISLGLVKDDFVFAPYKPGGIFEYVALVHIEIRAHKKEGMQDFYVLNLLPVADLGFHSDSVKKIDELAGVLGVLMQAEQAQYDSTPVAGVNFAA